MPCLTMIRSQPWQMNLAPRSSSICVCSGVPLTVPHHLPAFFGGGGDSLVGVCDERMIELIGDAGEDAQVAGAEHQHIDAGHAGDGVGLFEGARRFELGDEERVFVGGFQIVRAWACEQ